jgi:integrase
LIVEIALDTAMRHGEILKLAWEDLDFGTGTIRVQAGNTKTQETRQLGMTSRVRKGLLAERLAGGSATGKIFPFARIEKALKTACRLAGIEGLRFHDLRHTAITRMVNAGLPPAQIMKLSGHHQWGTFLRYVNPDGATATAAAEALDRFNQK